MDDAKPHARSAWNTRHDIADRDGAIRAAVEALEQVAMIPRSAYTAAKIARAALAAIRALTAVEADRA